MGYTAVTIVITVIVSFSFSAVVAGITGGRGMMGTPSSSMHLPAEGGFDKDSPGRWFWACCPSSLGMLMKISLSAVVLLLCSLVLANELQAAGSASVRVVQVIDGDSFKVERGGRYFQVRLWGIDAPEWRQAFSAQAKAVCRDLVAGKKVSLEEKYGDAYGRSVAVVRVDGTVLNEELVKRGMAWVHIRYCDEEVCSRWRDLEAEARRLQLGLWNNPRPVPPWRWKSQRRREGRHGY